MIHTYPAASGSRRLAYCDHPGCKVESRSIRLGGGEVITTVLKDAGWDLTNSGGRYSQFCPEHARRRVGYEPLRTRTPSPAAPATTLRPGAAQHTPAAGEGHFPRRTQP